MIYSRRNLFINLFRDTLRGVLDIFASNSILRWMQLRLQHSEPTDGEPGKHEIRGSYDPESEHEFE